MNRRQFLVTTTSTAVALPALAQAKKSYTFGLVAKSQGNPVFQIGRAHV